MNVTEKFVNEKIWKEFRSRFQSESTEASYWSDLCEFCRYSGKTFEETTQFDVEKYYKTMEERMRQGILSPLTVTKKFRELHSLAKFMIEENVGKNDYFYPYLKHLAKESSFARCVKIEEIDAILSACAEDIAAYTIITLMYRAGLSSTEIISLNGEENFLYCDDGLYVCLENRREPCLIPEDAERILISYMEKREKKNSLFYNRSGRRLNVMYISRMMKKYCKKAGIPAYSAEAVRNCCAYNMFAYGASETETAGQMGRTETHIRRYRGHTYKDGLKKNAGKLVKIHVEMP